MRPCHFEPSWRGLRENAWVGFAESVHELCNRQAFSSLASRLAENERQFRPACRMTENLDGDESMERRMHVRTAYSRRIPGPTALTPGSSFRQCA